MEGQNPTDLCTAPAVDQEKSRFKFANIRRPCCGLFLRGSVKHIAIINSFLAIANMAILGAAVVDLWPGFYDDLPPVKRYTRLGFLVYFYCFWFAEFYHSVVLYRASKAHDIQGCMRWLCIQFICYVLFISAYASHCIWIVNFEMAMEGARSRCFVHLVSAIYKPYTFWVIYSFVKEIRRNGNMDRIVKKLSDEIAEECYRAPKNANNGPLQAEIDSEIDMQQLTDLVLIGRGIQSNVYSATYRGSMSPMKVAVKVTKCTGLDYFKDQLEDLRIRSCVGNNENIVGLIGACTTDISKLELQIVMEYCEFGSLESFISSRRYNFYNQLDSSGTMTHPGIPESSTVIQTQDLLKWSLQAASGLCYLHSKNIIHNDVATRNMLLTSNRVVKLTDFGLSVQLDKPTGTARSKLQVYLPVLWMAPETFASLPQISGLSFESDVWSFGVALWEIFTLTDQPHEEAMLSRADITKGNLNGFFKKLLSQDLSRSEYAPIEVHQLMMLCWRLNPKDRTTFNEIALQLEKLVQKTSTLHPAGGESCTSGGPSCHDAVSPYVAFGLLSPQSVLPYVES